MLHCVSRYKSSLGTFGPGDIIEDQVLCLALLADSPGSFQAVAVDTTSPAEPEQNKAILKPRRGNK